MLEECWFKDVVEFVEKVKKKIGSVEAVLIFGSWVRSSGGSWSDIDLLLVSDSVHGMHPLERFKLISELRSGRIDLFIYSYRELEEMMRKGNPLALSVLIEGKPITASSRVLELAKKAKEMYVRINRMWVRKA